VLVGAIGLGVYIYFERPGWAEPYVGPILALVPGAPTAAPTSPPVPSGPVTFALEVTVPSGSNEAAILQAFRDKFARHAQDEYGTTVQVNRNVPPSYSGNRYTLVGDDGTYATYSAQMEGRLYPGQ